MTSFWFLVCKFKSNDKLIEYPVFLPNDQEKQGPQEPLLLITKIVESLSQNQRSAESRIEFKILVDL